MSRKIIFFVALFYFLTFVAAFVMSAPAAPETSTEASGKEPTLSDELEKARKKTDKKKAREEDLKELEKELEAQETAKEEDLTELKQEKPKEEVPTEDPFLKKERGESTETPPQSEEEIPLLTEEPEPFSESPEPTATQIPPTPPVEEEIPELAEMPVAETVIPDDPTEKAKEEKITVENNNKVVLEEISQKESPQSWGITLMGGTYRPDKYKGRGNDRFDQIYEGQDWFLNNKGLWTDVALEWQFLRLFGTLAAKASSGVWYIETNHDPTSIAGSLKRKYRLFAAPLTLGGVYRLHFWSNQPIIPFAEGGGGYITFRQTTAPNADQYQNIVRQIYVAGAGVQINSNIFDPKAARSFDINWGVNRTHFIAEYRIIRSADNDEFDFSGQDLITAGLLFEF